MFDCNNDLIQALTWFVKQFRTTIYKGVLKQRFVYFMSSKTTGKVS